MLDLDTAERRLQELERCAQRDGLAKVRLWPAHFPDYALEVRQDSARNEGPGGFAYRQTGSSPRGLSRGEASGRLRLFESTLEESEQAQSDLRAYLLIHRFLVGPKSKAPWLKAGPEPYLATCERCCRTVAKPPMPTPVDAFVKYCEYAAEAHRLCQVKEEK